MLTSTMSNKVYTSIVKLFRLTVQAIALMLWCHHISGISADFDYMRVADAFESQKSQDCDITEKLP
jgi:hypothetical protein